MAGACHGLRTADVVVIKEAARAAYEYDDAAANRLMCKVAAAIYALAGDSVSPYYCLFEKLASVPVWKKAYNQFTDAVYNVVGGEWRERCRDEAEFMQKMAGLGSALTGLGRLGLSTAPSVLKALPAVGIAAGAGLGSLYWLANRHADADDVDNTALKAKVDYYRALAHDISEQLTRKGVAKPDKKDEDKRETEVTSSIY
jgi:hypothetical protein